MTKQEFLTASLPYDLKVKIICGDGVYDTTNKLTIKNLYEFGISRFKPIIRPLDSLTKECVQSDYNEGNPFVPIKELEGLFPYCNFYLLDDNGKTVIGFDNRDYDNDVTIEDMMLIIQQLLKWHFYPNMPDNEEVVYVNEDFNPYK